MKRLQILILLMAWSGTVLAAAPQQSPPVLQTAETVTGAAMKQTGTPGPQTPSVGVASMHQTGIEEPQLTKVDAREIVRRSVEHDQINWQRAANYTCIEEVTVEKLDGDGKQKSVDTDTYEWLVLYGQPWRRHLEHNGAPLDAKQAAKEQAKLDRFTADRQHETAEQRDKRLKETEQNRKRKREFVRDIPNAFDFRVLREENLRGHEVWVVDAMPRPDYRGSGREGQVLRKLHATLWIDKSEYQWVKMEGELLDDVSFGIFLAKLHKGSTLHLEQSKINGEIWLPQRYIINAGARIGFISQRAHITDEFSKYRKFTAESRIVSAK